MTTLTEGSISKGILVFALPIFLGNLFQQMYNAADTLIVGNFLGSNALAAVASSGNLINLMIGFFNGIAMGAGVVVARHYGAKRQDLLDKAIHTDVTVGMIMGLVVTLIGSVLTPQLLQWMGTPADVMPNSVAYFRMYFMGGLGLVMYNFFVGILMSLGDSKHPLHYLIISSLINIILDYAFIGLLGYGVWSAALATILSQFVSAILCLIQLIRMGYVRLSSLSLDPHMVADIMRNGIPSGIQNSIIGVANVVVQANINVFGSLAMAGSGVYSKIEGFAFLPITSFNMAITTFVSQNLGARQEERARRGARFGIFCSILVAELIGIIMFVFAPQLCGLFTQDAQVIQFGVDRSHVDCLFFFLLAYSHCMAAVLRGAQKPTIPMLVMMICWCLVRVTFLTVTGPIFHNIFFVYWVYPLTWALSSLCFWFYGKRTDWFFSRKAI